MRVEEDYSNEFIANLIVFHVAHPGVSIDTLAYAFDIKPSVASRLINKHYYGPGPTGTVIVKQQKRYR